MWMLLGIVECQNLCDIENENVNSPWSYLSGSFGAAMCI